MVVVMRATIPSSSSSSPPALLLRHTPSPSPSLLRLLLHLPTPWNSPPLLSPFRPARLTRLARSRNDDRDGDLFPRQKDPRPSVSGEKLWRKELLEQQFQEDSGNDDENEDPETFFLNDPSFLVEQEMIRSDESRELQNQELKKQKLRRDQQTQTLKQSEGEGSLLGSVVEKMLVADFFFIIFILGWFVAGLAEKAAFDTSSLIDVWLPLWPILFQPALGFFMAGAIWTAVSKFLFNK